MENNLLYVLGAGVLAMLFSFSDSAESSFYTFNGHVAPWIIVFAIIITISGFKGISQVKNKKL